MTPPARRLKLGLVPTVVLVLVGLCVAGYLTNGDEPSAPAAASPTEAPPYDRAAFEAYWAAYPSDAARELVTSVDWSAGALTAHTKLFARDEAIEPAAAICGGLAGFWVQTGQSFRPVRVLDGADQILTSRHTEGDACTWRR